MPTPTMESPNVGNLQVGKGNVELMLEGESEWRHLGNCTAFTVTPEVETLEHFSSMEGTRKKDLVITIEQQATVSMTLEEMTAFNAALMVQGALDEAAIGGPEVEIFGAAGAKTGRLRFTGTNDVGPKITVDLYYVQFNPDGDMEMISDEFNAMEITGDVLVAPTGNANAGKFGLMKWTNVTDVS